jgi:VWFA-related protein
MHPMMAARLPAITLWIVADLCGSAGGGSIQEPAEVSSRQTPVVFQSSSNLVQIPVVVRDSKGSAVGNLRADDFRLSDNGKPQLISRFTVEQMQTREGFGTRPSGPGQKTASPPAAGAPNRFIVYLADDVNLTVQDFIRGRTAALRHVQTLGPSDRASVLTTSRLVTLPFTNDRDALTNTLLGISSLNRPATWLDPTLRCKPMTFYRADLIVANDPQALRDCGEGPQARPDEHSMSVKSSVMLDAEAVLQASHRDLENYLGALEKLIDQMAELPGDRVIVLLSPGMYVPHAYRKDQTALISRAIRNKVVISGVDVRGVTVRFPIGPDPTTALTRIAMDETAERIGFMTDLATGTGGMFLQGNNDLDLQLRRAASAPEFVYVLGFSPSDVRFDGRLHTVKVALANPRGLSVQARSSYYAPDSPSDPGELAKQQMEEAFFSSRELKDLPVQLSTAFFKEGDDATLTVRAKVDTRKLPFRKEQGRNRDDLGLVVGIFDQNGNFLSAYRKVIEMRLKDETLTRWLESGIETATDFHVKPGRYLVRLVVRDQESQTMAEQSTGVVIP